MTFLLEAETRNYWRALHTLGAAQASSDDPQDLSDELAELEVIALHSQSPRLRALCRGTIDRIYAQAAAKAAARG